MLLQAEDVIVEGFVDEMEKHAGAFRAVGKFLPWAVGAGVLSRPFVEPYIKGQMMQGAQGHGEYQRPQFNRRFGQHLTPPSATESFAMGAEDVARKAKKVAPQAREALGTAASMLQKGPEYIKANFQPFGG